MRKRLKKLANETGKRFVILHRHPILTSTRRLKQRSPFVAFKALYYIMFPPRNIRVSREKARIWYDSRN